jgi:hypothetical protein
MAAGDAVVKGTATFTEQPNVRRWVNGKGWVTVRTWMGPLDTTQIDATVAVAVAAKAETVDVRRGHPTEIQATIPDAYDPGSINPDGDNNAVEWSLDPYDLQKALGTHGKFLSSAASTRGLAAIEADIRAGTAYAKNYAALYAEGSESNYDAYANLRGQGTDTWLSFAYTLRKVTTYESTSSHLQTDQLNAQNQGKIISWEKIVADEGLGPSAKIEKPWLRIYVGAAMGVLATAYAHGTSSTGWVDLWFNEWLVKPAAIRYVRQGRSRRRQIVKEFIGAVQWSSTLYEGGTGTP